MMALLREALAWITEKKWHSWLLILIVLVVIGSVFKFYPGTTLVVGVNSDQVDANGNLKNEKGPLAKIKNQLAAQGVRLKIKTQSNKKEEKSTLEFLVEDPEVDWVVARNSGAEFDEDLYERFSSLGVISYSPLVFFEKTGKARIKKLKDLRGKKIIFRAAPEGNEIPAFTSAAAKVSPYSNNYIIQNFFDMAGITPENTKLINTWPDQITDKGDWDVYITFGFPSERNSSKGIYPALLSGKIDFLQLDDLDAVAKKLSYLSVQKLPASAMVPAQAIPAADVRYLSTTSSVLAKANLDRTLVMILAEALDKVYAPANLTRAKDEFPNFRSTETFKPNPVAEEFYKSGRPLLGKYFPLVVAGLLGNMLVVLIPIVTVVWPIAHFFPSLYRIYVRRKVTPWYKKLEFIERNCDVQSEDLRNDLKRQLHEVEKGLLAIKLPLMYGAYVQDVFNAKSHVELVKSKLYRTA
ncbi:MAG: hypothetical protein Q7U91_16345 [Sideroxyarcus sp.]|nr:hypothetical protein [Sideroxyarcus sp.]